MWFRLRFLGKVLSVERASKVIEDTKHKKSETQTRKDTDSMMKDASVPKVSTDHSRGGHSHASEPIADKLGVDYPFPLHLEYVTLCTSETVIIFVVFSCLSVFLSPYPI